MMASNVWMCLGMGSPNVLKQDLVPACLQASLQPSQTQDVGVVIAPSGR